MGVFCCVKPSPTHGWMTINRLKSVIKENRKSGKKRQKKEKHPYFDEIHELIVEVNRHITNRITNMATAIMQTDEVDSAASDKESVFCSNCKTQVVDGICCEFCEVWFHYAEECSGVENTENKILENKHILMYAMTATKQGNQRNKSRRQTAI